jgi:hypothetical protein
MLGRMGYYNYQNGLIYHHLNQEGQWEDHQEHCRNFILRAIELYNPQKVTILGSGWLLDLPLAELTERISKVDLIDIIHPPDVINQIKNYRNVELIEDDVTGGLIAEVWQKAGKAFFIKKARLLGKINIPDYEPKNDPGLIISLNLLTQLESLIIDFIKKRSNAKEEDLSVFRSEIQHRHINFLEKYHSVIITDYAEVITGRTGIIKTIPTLFTELPAGKVREEWIWNFDKKGGDLYNSMSQFKVIALIN